jgi:hypothetical protein
LKLGTNWKRMKRLRITNNLANREAARLRPVGCGVAAFACFAEENQWSCVGLGVPMIWRAKPKLLSAAKSEVEDDNKNLASREAARLRPVGCGVAAFAGFAEENQWSCAGLGVSMIWRAKPKL